MSGLPKEIPVFIPGAGEMILCHIPKGRFWMGSRGASSAEAPIHRVVITRDFYLGEFPVTQRQFAAWRGTREYDEWFASHRALIKETGFSVRSNPHENDFDGVELPADSVTWWEAAEYANWLNRQCKADVLPLPGEWHFRLPTEAEWEYACRAETRTEYWNGDGIAALAPVGWFAKNSGETTHPMSDSPPNPWGLRAMHGNVWEWCLDVYKSDAYQLRVDGVEDPCVAGEKADRRARVLRGGAWIGDARFCSSAYRDWDAPGNRIRYDGFRLA